jgi:BirA family biotin operon repressor/biotin-[acetyl-CoA-carboxylase] ligase
MLIEFGTADSRETILAAILNEWEPLFDDFLGGDHARIRERWRVLGPPTGTPIVRREGEVTVSGWFEDIGEQGQMLLRDESGAIHEVFSGDVQL